MTAEGAVREEAQAHPLEDLVLWVLARAEQIDADGLARAMHGETKPPADARKLRAYRVVALDVLQRMEAAGRLERPGPVQAPA